MREVDGHEVAFERYMDRLRNQRPSQFRVRRLTRKCRLLHMPQGRGIYNLLAETGDQDLTNFVVAEYNQEGSPK